MVGDVSECACPTLSGLFPHPSSCAHMCHCIMGQPRVLKCRKGQHFHSQVRVCVKKRLSDCDTRTKSKTKKRLDAKQSSTRERVQRREVPTPGIDRVKGNSGGVTNLTSRRVSKTCGTKLTFILETINYGIRALRLYKKFQH